MDGYRYFFSLYNIRRFDRFINNKVVTPVRRFLGIYDERRYEPRVPTVTYKDPALETKTQDAQGGLERSVDSSVEEPAPASDSTQIDYDTWEQSQGGGRPVWPMH